MQKLNHIGVYNEKIPEDLFKLLKQEVFFLKDKILMKDKLAGNIKEEYLLTHLEPLAEKTNYYLLSLINKSEHAQRILKKEITRFKNLNYPNISLDKLWVNFQKKHEFNPFHEHSGLFSFIIFLKIPYDLKEELEKGPGANSNNNLSSVLQFFVTGIDGRVTHHDVLVDKSFEGGIYFFDARLNHCVNPFYTSDDYRITVSGNLSWTI